MIGMDLDGTIEDSRRDMIAAVQRVRAQLGLSARKAEAVFPWINRGMDVLYRNCFEDFIEESGERLSEVRMRYEADYLEHLVLETTLYPGIFEALEALVALRPLVVVTNKPEHISRRLLERLGIEKFFGAIIGGDTCAAQKPDRRLLVEAARRCGFDPSGGRRSVMIGDSAGDIAMGQAFGARTIWCAWGYSEPPGLVPDLVAKSPTDLPGLAQRALEQDRV